MDPFEQMTEVAFSKRRGIVPPGRRRRWNSGAAIVLALLVAVGLSAGCRGTTRPETGESLLTEALREQGVRIVSPETPAGAPAEPTDNAVLPAVPATAGADNVAPGGEAPPAAGEGIAPIAPPVTKEGAEGPPPAAPATENAARAPEVAAPEQAEGGPAPKAAPAPAPEQTAPKAEPTPGAEPAHKGNGNKVAMAGTGKRKPQEGAAPARPVPTPSAEPPVSEPPWAQVRETLSYRVDFLGITMGYARFTTMGKTVIDGREVYHLQVRAWTTSILALIYPVNDTIDYYIDVHTLAPLRQDYTHQNKASEDDIATYDQKTGIITWRYKKNGAIRQKQEGPPIVYDPVTLAYLFRARDVSTEQQARNVYAGRKFWQIHARPLGTERLETGGGAVDTFVVQPIIRREGKLENKGDLRMWITKDRRRIPVRFYAKFVKFRTWTLVGELVPNA